VRRADNFYHHHLPIILKSGSLNLLEPSGPVQACNVFCVCVCVCVCVFLYLIRERRLMPDGPTRSDEFSSGFGIRASRCRRPDLVRVLHLGVDFGILVGNHRNRASCRGSSRYSGTVCSYSCRRMYGASHQSDGVTTLGACILSHDCTSWAQ
jgi:hypothetical protein